MDESPPPGAPGGLNEGLINGIPLPVERDTPTPSDLVQQCPSPKLALFQGGRECRSCRYQ